MSLSEVTAPLASAPTQGAPALTLADVAGSDPAISQALLAAIVESSDDAIVSKTLEGRILSWNAAAARIFGYEAAEVIGKPITIIIPEELRAEEARILEKLRRGESIDHFDTTRLTKDGRRIAISLTISPIRDSRGAIVGASKVARDVSERRRADQSLRESERRFAAEANALGKLNDWSTRLWASRTLEKGLEEMLGATIQLLGADQGSVQLLDSESGALSTVAQRGQAPRDADTWPDQQVVIEDVEGEERDEPLRKRARAAGYRSLISTPLIGADGMSLGVISTHFRAVHRPNVQELRRLDLYLRQATDFIERCRLEAGLRETQAALREAARRKDEFLALLAHELRNPLAPIRYALATARKAGRTLEQRRRAEEVIERQLAHMSHLLDDLLDISRITHGTLDLKRTPTELGLVVATAIETARPILDAKHHTFTLELPKQPVPLAADAVRLSQVFSNLLINAAKYTDPGGQIQLRALQQGKEIVVRVRDNGIGIPAQMMPRLFRLFSQGHTEPGRKEGGLGVGLALVRGLVTLHGGSVDAASEGIGRGSEFTVRLPVVLSREEGAAQEVAADSSDTGPGLNVLVVDDNRDSADTCAMLLELSGHRVRTAYTARGALELGARFHPDALLLDIGLPDLDGYELAQSVRATPWGHGAVLVAITGWGQDEDRRRALQAGFDHHLTKPVVPERLESLLQSLPRASTP